MTSDDKLIEGDLLTVILVVVHRPASIHEIHRSNKTYMSDVTSPPWVLFIHRMEPETYLITIGCRNLPIISLRGISRVGC